MPTIRCSYCVEGGQFKVMIGQAGGDWYTCARCGHLAMPNNSHFTCTCANCVHLQKSGAKVSHGEKRQPGKHDFERPKKSKGMKRGIPALWEAEDMPERKLHIVSADFPLLAVCELCNARFKSFLPKAEDAEKEIRSKFEAHRCEPNDAGVWTGAT